MSHMDAAARAATGKFLCGQLDEVIRSNQIASPNAKAPPRQTWDNLKTHFGTFTKGNKKADGLIESLQELTGSVATGKLRMKDRTGQTYSPNDVKAVLHFSNPVIGNSCAEYQSTQSRAKIEGPPTTGATIRQQVRLALLLFLMNGATIEEAKALKKTLSMSTKLERSLALQRLYKPLKPRETKHYQQLDSEAPLQTMRALTAGDPQEVSRLTGNKSAGLCQAFNQTETLKRTNPKLVAQREIPPFACVSTVASEALFNFRLIDLNIDLTEAVQQDPAFQKLSVPIQLPATLAAKGARLRDISDHVRNLQHEIRHDKSLLESDRARLQKEMVAWGAFTKQTLQRPEFIQRLKTIPGFEAGLRQQLQHIHKEGYRYLAIRSSSIKEDTDHNAAAGLYDTKIGTKIDLANIDPVLSDIAAVVGSMYSENALIHDLEAESGSFDNGMGVMIQGLFLSQISGVVFSKSPSDPNKAVLTLGPGQGEGLVSGMLSGLSIKASRTQLDDFARRNIKFEDIHLEVDPHGGNCNQYVDMLEDPATGDLRKENVQLHGYQPIAFHTLATKLGLEDQQLDQLKDVVRTLLVNSYQSELANGSYRDQEFGVLNDRQHGLQFALTQDRTLVPSQHKVAISSHHYRSWGQQQFNGIRVHKPLTNGIGTGTVISSADFFRLSDDQLSEDGQKYVVVCHHATEQMKSRLKYVAGVVAQTGELTDHMSTELDGKGIPLVSVSAAPDMDRLADTQRGKTLTLANVTVDGTLQSLLFEEDPHGISWPATIAENKLDEHYLDGILEKVRNRTDSDAGLIARGEVRSQVNRLTELLSSEDPKTFGKVLKKLKIPAEDWLNQHGKALELNDILLKECAQLKSAQLLRRIEPVTLNPSQLGQLADDLPKLVGKEGPLEEISTNLKAFASLYMLLLQKQDLQGEEYVDQFVNRLFDIQSQIEQQIREFVTLVSFGDYQAARQKLGALKELMFDNGRGEAELVEVTNPAELKGVQEVIRFVHRKLYQDLNDAFIGRYGERINAQKIRRQGMRKHLVFGDQADLPSWQDSLIDTYDVYDILQRNKRLAVIRSPHQMTMDFELGKHSCETRVICDPKAGDGNRIEITMRDGDSNPGKMMRYIYMEQIVGHLKQQGLIGQDWEVSHGESDIKFVRGSVDFEHWGQPGNEDMLAQVRVLNSVLKYASNIDLPAGTGGRYANRQDRIHNAPGLPIRFEPDGTILEADPEFLRVAAKYALEPRFGVGKESKEQMDIAKLMYAVYPAYKEMVKTCETDDPNLNVPTLEAVVATGIVPELGGLGGEYDDEVVRKKFVQMLESRNPHIRNPHIVVAENSPENPDSAG